MAFANVQDRDSGAVAGGGTFAFLSNVTAGNLITVSAWHPSADDFTPTDSLSNTYTLALKRNAAASWSASAGWIYIFYAYNITGGACTITCNATGFTYLTIGEYSGSTTADPLDITNGADGSGLTPSVTLTGCQANDLLIGAYAGGATMLLPGTGFTERRNSTAVNAEASEDDIDSGAAGNPVVDMTLSSSVGWHIIAASFKLPAAGTNTSVKRLIGGGVLTSGLTA